MEHTTDSSGASRGTYGSYGIGFILSITLTLIAFGVVMSGALSRPVILVTITITAVAQILVQLHYFLHLDTSSSLRWNMLALIFTILLMALFAGGSLWIMYSLNYRMM
jgi:cytochrome o ubiquinol oxidase operon protein cyoD